MSFQNRRERARAELLFTLDEHGEAEVEVSPEGFHHDLESGRVNHDASLVVGSPSAIEASVPNLRLKRSAAPLGGIAGRLDIVMRV